MKYIIPYLDIHPTFNTNDYSLSIKNTIGKIKDEINYDTILSKLLKNGDFIKFIKETNHNFRFLPNYYNDDVQQCFDIYGGVYNETHDNIEYTIKIYFYKLINVELLTQQTINKFELIFRYDYFVKNNILNMTWHNYRLNLFSENINQNSKQFYKEYNHSSCRNKLYYHQQNNISRMIDIHNKSTDIYISDNMPIYFDNDLIYDMVQNKFIQKEEICKYKIHSGMILDEPGTGKTLQFILYLLETKLNSLVLVPNENIKFVWEMEFVKHINLDTMPFTILTFQQLQQNIALTENYLDYYDIIGIDEIHILYKNNLTLFNKIVESNIKYRWGITGTPFVNDDSLFNIINFLTGKKFQNQRIANIPSLQNDFMKLFLKNCKIDMINDYVWPELKVHNVFVNLDIVQQNIYDTEKKLCINTNNLRKLVCELELLFSGGNIQTPKDLKEYCIKHYKDLYEKENSKLVDLMFQYDNILKNQKTFKSEEFGQRKEHYTKLITKQKQTVNTYKSAYEYISSNIEKISNIINKNKNDDDMDVDDEEDEDEDLCTICLGDFEAPIAYLKQCGHYFCKSCLDTNIKGKNKFKCPLCRKDLDKSDTIIVSDIKHINYSPKVHEVMKIIQEKPDEKFIIFTQFDKLINNFEQVLNTSTIKFEVFKQNIHKDTQVLLLSSNNNAEGINLSMFDNIIIFEPFEISMFYKEIEKQLIARIHRVGRINEVNVYRMITCETIEEEIYQ
jgi:SNF2 family DNA or RNA helicase